MLNRCRIRALPVMSQPSFIPFLRQLPTRLHGHRISQCHLPPRQPHIQMILRPEGEDRRSGVADVFPKPHRGNHKVDEPIAIHCLPVANGQFETLVTLSAPARGVPNGIFAQNGGNAEDIPHSVPPVQTVFNFGHIVRRES